jgi:hypothetical protein
VDSTWGTVYTVAYAPAELSMTLLWPDDSWPLSVLGVDQGGRARTVLSMVPDLGALHLEQPRIPHQDYLT